MMFANMAQAATGTDPYWAARAEAYWVARRALIPPAVPPGEASQGNVQTFLAQLRVYEVRLQELQVEWGEIRRDLRVRRWGI